MLHSQDSHIGQRNTRIQFQTWQPKGVVRAAVVIVHGLGEHGGRYAHVARRLVRMGCTALALDHAALTELAQFVDWLPSVLPMLKLPMLLMHGEQDQLAGVAGSRRVFEQVSSPDKTPKVYEGLHHEVFNELPADRARVLDDMAHWLDTRLAA